MADETMLVQPPDHEHTSHTVTKMAADLSAYADYIVPKTGVTSYFYMSLTRFHGVIVFQSPQLWWIRIWVEHFCVSYIKTTAAVNDVWRMSVVCCHDTSRGRRGGGWNQLYYTNFSGMSTKPSNPLSELAHEDGLRFKRQTTVYEIETLMAVDFAVYSL